MAQVKDGSNQRLMYLQSGQEGSENWHYYHQTRLGEGKLGAATQEISCLAGLPNWIKKTNHSLCQTAINALANDPNVNALETATLACHTNVNSHHEYVRPSNKSKMNYTAALEVKTESTEPTDELVANAPPRTQQMPPPPPRARVPPSQSMQYYNQPMETNTAHAHPFHPHAEGAAFPPPPAHQNPFQQYQHGPSGFI